MRIDLMEKMYVELQDIKRDVKINTEKLENIDRTVLSIEQNHGRKLEALFDGYKQNSEQLNLIGKEYQNTRKLS